MSLEVIQPGIHTSIQDLGREDYQMQGVPVAGSMDDYAHRLANILVGNKEDASVMEMTAMGGTYKFYKRCIIAITGADMLPVLNDNMAIKMWRTLVIHPGDTITFGFAAKGSRTYLSVAGSFDLPKVLGSYSTYVRGQIGGFEGRVLKKGDKIPLGETRSAAIDLLGRFIRVKYIPSYEKDVTLGVVLGPQKESFTDESLLAFVDNIYTVTNEVDRMGYRLEGQKIHHVKSADIISEGIIKGAVQVPSHGQPIIMMSDCQTIGGYTKIAYVISSDLWKVAQIKSGEKIRFKEISMEEAHEFYKKRIGHYSEIQEQFNQYRLKGYEKELIYFD